MSSGFLLLETQPGREHQVLDLVGKVAGVTQSNVLFPAAVAVRLEATHVEPLVAQLGSLEGVIRARLYRARLT